MSNRGVIYWLGLATLIIMGAKPIDAAVFQLWPFGRDASDGAQRSGMALKTDYGTGCQYLLSPWGGITPRVDGQGKHICEDMRHD